MDAARDSRADAGDAGIGLRYAALGYELLFPADVLRLSREELKRVAAGAMQVLDEVYCRRAELSAGRTRQLTEDVVDGRVHLFVLRDRERSVVATMAFIKFEPMFGGDEVSFYEVGRVAKRLDSPPQLATGLIRAGFIWAAGHLDGDYVVAEARVACAEADRPYNGRMLARVLGHRNFMPAHAVYSHYVAQTEAEPFVWACAALNPEAWYRTVRRQQVHLPDNAESRMLEAMLAESRAARVVFAEPGDDRRALPGEIREVVAPSPTDESLYVLTRHPMPSRRVLAEIPGVTRSDGVRGSAGLNDRLILEEDIVGRPESTGALRAFHQAGFHLAGWVPSRRRFGRLALVMARPGTVPAGRVSVTSPDLSALAHLPAAHSFLTRVLSRRPRPELREAVRIPG